MPRRKSWTDEQLIVAVAINKSIRSVLITLGLIPAGGNYDQVRRRIRELNLDTIHFTGQGWNKNGRATRFAAPLSMLLVQNSTVQSHKLKKRLIAEGLKTLACELCGWNKMSIDGRIPLELDHINGNHSDNRLKNLRILCPNCHSLQMAHRGRNKKIGFARMVE